MDLNPPAFGGWRTCNDTMCSRTPTLNSPQEWLAACFTVFNPLIRAPIILCQPEAIGAETVSLGKWLFSRKQKLTQCLQALPSKPSLSQPSLPVRKTELPNLTALIACKSQSLAALSPTYVIHILYIGTYFNIEYVTWGEMQPLSLMDTALGRLWGEGGWGLWLGLLPAPCWVLRRGARLPHGTGQREGKQHGISACYRNGEAPCLWW